MRILRKLDNNKGTSIVLFAFAVTVIFGISALVVDFGVVSVKKSQFQNAIDACALAAAQELPDTSKAKDMAMKYIESNGFKKSDITVSFDNSGKVIIIDGNLTINYLFARILGFESATIKPTAKAALTNGMGGPFDYVLFSGSESFTLNLNGSQHYIGGNTHTNYNFTMNGSDNTITGACEASGTLRINGGSVNVPNRCPGASFIEMPDFSEKIRIEAEKAGNLFVGNKTLSSSNINVDKPLYIDGDLTINGSHFTGNGCILVTGNITFNGSNLTNSIDDAVAFYSKDGNITINGSSAELTGIVYAPNGKILLNGSNQQIHGRVIGDKVTFNGSKINITGRTNDFTSLPYSSSTKLIK